jgi:hypothetical protein
MNARDLNGAVAIMQRGVVAFVEKARKAQAAGAVALVVLNTGDEGDAHIRP